MHSSRSLIVIVNYNQEQEIRPFLMRVMSQLAQSAIPCSVILVDDCSNDDSPKIASEMGFEVVRHECNKGVGAAIRTGLKIALSQGFEQVVILSSNGKMQPEEIPQVLGPVDLGLADYVQGSRRIEGGRSEGLSLFRTISIPLFSLFTSVLLGRRFTDISCGFRAYKVGWLKDSCINLDQDWLDRYGLEFYLHYWACQKGLRIKEVPVTIKYSHLKKGRKSYIRPIVGWWSMIRPFLYLSFGLRR